MDKGLWYIKDNLKTVHKDRYYLMCYVDAYEKYHAPMPDDASIDGGIPIPSKPYKKHFYHLVTQSTFLIIGFNDLKSITRTESKFIKVRWVGYSKISQNHFLQNNLMIIKKTKDNYKGSS